VLALVLPLLATAPGEREWTEPPHRATIYLNFYGAILEPGNNAALDQAPCIDQTLAYPGFPQSQQQAMALVQVFESLLEPFGIHVVWEERPPAHLPYAMVMIGGKAEDFGLGSGILGLACEIDCGDSWWRDVTYSFAGGKDVTMAGQVAVHEAAHAWGLDHIDDENCIMYPVANSVKRSWATECTPYNTSTGEVECQAAHDEICGEGAGKQDSYAELMAIFGPSGQDDEPPEAVILAPEPGEMLTPDEPFTIEVEVTDNHQGFGWKLEIPEAEWEQVAYDQETTFEVTLPEGTYTLRVEAIDHDRNVGEDSITLHVGTIPDGTGTETATDTGDAAALGEPVASCACGTGGRAVPWAWSLWLLACVALRPRRSAGHPRAIMVR